MLSLTGGLDHVHAQSTAEVAITTAEGTVIRGELVEIGADGVHVDRGSEVTILPLEDLSQLRFDHPAERSLPMQAQLSNGSLLSISGVTLTDQSVQIAVSRQSPLVVPVERLQWVRFRMGTPATDPAWLGWLEERRRADRLVVRRNEKALDSIDGTVIGIGRDAVQFEMRGNRIDAPLAKLEGVLMSTSTDAEVASALRVRDTSGSVWAAASLKLPRGGSSMQVNLPGAIEHEIPLGQVMEINFAGGILSLADAEIADVSFGSGGGGPTTAHSQDFAKWFDPQASDGVIGINAPGKITLRIPDGYQKLIVAVRRAPDVSQFTALGLEVLLDGEIKWTGVLQDRQSLGLELPLGGARQLTLSAMALPKTNSETSPKTSSPKGSVSAELGGRVEWFSGRLLK